MIKGLNPLFAKRWIYGIPAPIWLDRAALIEKFIKEFKLKPAPVDALPVSPLLHMQQALPMIQEKTLPRLTRKDFPGGIRLPHFHSGGEVFLLNPEQWQKFSGVLLKDMQSRLAAAKQVSFEQAMELSEAIDVLAAPHM